MLCILNYQTEDKIRVIYVLTFSEKGINTECSLINHTQSGLCVADESFECSVHTPPLSDLSCQLRQGSQ